MAIDINLIRNAPEVVRDSEKKRCRSGSVVDKVLALDEEWRRSNFEMDQARRKQNELSKAIATTKKADPKADVSEIAKQSADLKAQLPKIEEKTEQLLKQREDLIRKIGNIVHSSVIASGDENNNEVIRTWGVVDTSKSDMLPHYDIMAKLNGLEMKQANEVAGHRAYYLKGHLVMLNQALIQYGLSFLRSKGYENVQVPFFMKRDWMLKTAELQDFEETLYKIPSSTNDKDAEREDMFLIATSEQPLCALHAGEYMDKQLPRRYAGLSTCFRKEAGSHGKDMRGIFRVHQFDKVEQFIICEPTTSWEHHDEMIKISEEFYQSLDIPYRVVSIVAGALNDAAARKYDLEAWFPSYSNYKELVSCSNCTDFQSRDLSIRYGTPTNEKEKVHVHMLNGTLTATERTLCCLLENYQTPTGIIIPRPLRPYCDGLDFLPFN